MRNEIKVDGEFGFTVSPPDPDGVRMVRHANGVPRNEPHHGPWLVYLAGGCSCLASDCEKTVAFGAEKDDAIRSLVRFIAEADAALGVLRDAS